MAVFGNIALRSQNANYTKLAKKYYDNKEYEKALTQLEYISKDQRDNDLYNKVSIAYAKELYKSDQIVLAYFTVRNLETDNKSEKDFINKIIKEYENIPAKKSDNRKKDNHGLTFLDNKHFEIEDKDNLLNDRKIVKMINNFYNQSIKNDIIEGTKDHGLDSSKIIYTNINLEKSGDNIIVSIIADIEDGLAFYDISFYISNDKIERYNYLFND